MPLGVDSRFVYFHRTHGELGRGQIWRVPHEGGKEALVLDEQIYSWEWGIWKDKLVYIDRFQPEGPAIRMLDLADSRSATLALLDAESFPGLLAMQGNEFLWGGLTVSPDGRWILYGKHTISDADLMVIESAR